MFGARQSRGIERAPWGKWQRQSQGRGRDEYIVRSIHERMTAASAQTATATRINAANTTPAVMSIRRRGRVWVSSMTGDYPAPAVATHRCLRVIGAGMVSWYSTWGNLASILPGG